MGSLKDLSKEIEALVEKASQSVVRVDARRGRAGTGIVWDSGLVLTANHVVEQAEDIGIVVDGKSAKASLVGRDPATDLALLKVDGLSAPAMPRAKVSDLKPGQIVLAIGRPGSLKATFGTISAVSSSWRGWRGSEIEHLIQTNAPLYPGFSGGPLVVAIEPQSPADKAGLMQGDTMVALNGTVTNNLEDLYAGLRKIKVGATQTVKVVRAGEVKEIAVTVGEAGR